MTRLSPVSAVILALCACGGPAPVEPTAGPAEGGPAAVAAPAPVAAAASLPEWSDKYWVILQSDKDAAKVPPSLGVIQQHPELKLTPARLPSTKFKNLMPCFEVIVAGSWADKAAALDVSKQLAALGVDNYVKNAGAYLAETQKLDGYCAAATPEPQTSGPGLGFVDTIAGATYLRTELDGDVFERALATAPRARPVGGDLDTWSRDVAAETVGPYKKGAKLDVLAMDGTTAACQIAGFEAITVGTPHFGYYDKEINPDPPAGPGCGTEELFAQLDCDRRLAGPGFAYPQGKAPAPAVPGDAIMKETADAAAKVLKDSDLWKRLYDSLPEKRQISMSVEQWKVGGKAYALTVAHVEAEGECGGVDDVVYVVHELVGNHLGVMVVAPASSTWGTLLGLADVDQDGKPEVVTRDFSGSVRVDGESSDWSWEISYCDCPC